MKKINTAPISGMMELLPEAQKVFDQIRENIARVYRLHGFQRIETPTIDRTEVLLAKAGGDTEKQIYKVVKTLEAAESADQALRFDHTVPLARYVVEHEPALAFPFRVTQIGKNFRGERAQKGRFRELYQCDVDVIGRNTLPIAYDAEVIAVFYEALKTFVRPRVQIRISNRKILNGFLDNFNLNDQAEQIFSIIDHAEKVPPEKTHRFLEELNIGSEWIRNIEEFMQIRGTREEVISALRGFKIENPVFLEGVSELETVLSLLEQRGMSEEICGDMLIVRGLDYYTGTVFETILPEYKEVGSIGSGGRYENLAGNFTDQSFPGVGASIGLSRLYYVLAENGLLDDLFGVSGRAAGAMVDYALIPISQEELPFTYETARKLREKGFSVDIILSEKKLGDRITHAAKVAKYGVVIGSSEVDSGVVKAKEYATGEESVIEL